MLGSLIRVDGDVMAAPEGTSVLSAVNDDGSTASGSSFFAEIVREGAPRMPAVALEAEVNAYAAELADQRDERGHLLVVRNGCHQPRKVTQRLAWSR